MNAPVRLAGRGEDEVRKQASAALLLFGALTIASAAKRELEGPTAFIAFWSLAAPAASVLLWIRVRRSAAPLATAAVAAATVLIVLTFAVGAATGSSAAADTALGLGLMAIGTAAGLRLLVACGATIAFLALLLAVLGPESEALVPAVTGSALMAWGIAGRGAGRTRHSSPPRPSPAISSAQPASFSTGGLARSRERAAVLDRGACRYGPGPGRPPRFAAGAQVDGGEGAKPSRLSPSLPGDARDSTCTSGQGGRHGAASPALRRGESPRTA